jgi:hypothetical protein
VDLPDEEPSPYALEGSLAHDLAERWLDTGERPEGDDAMMMHVETYVQYVQSRREHYPHFAVEQQFALSADSWGTADAVLWDPEAQAIEVVDFKYGRGVVVNPEENYQLMFYALGMVRKLGFVPYDVRLTVVQPRAGDPAVRTWECPPVRLSQFNLDMKEAVERIQDPQSPAVPGDWCRWCRAKAVCPAMKDRADQVALRHFRDAMPPAPGALTQDQVVAILENSDLISEWLKAVKAYAHDVLEMGGEIEGWTLVDGVSRRRWKDPAAVEKLLRRSGKVRRMMLRKLPTPAEAERMADTDPDLLAALSSLWEKPTPKKRLQRTNDE